MESEAIDITSRVVKKWLFFTDFFEYYILCSDCFYQAGDQWTGSSGDHLPLGERNALRLKAWEEWRESDHCEQCNHPLTKTYPAMDGNCPMQDNCSEVPNNSHYHYPGDCKLWEECSAVYANLRNNANDEEEVRFYEQIRAA